MELSDTTGFQFICLSSGQELPILSSDTHFRHYRHIGDASYRHTLISQEGPLDISYMLYLRRLFVYDLGSAHYRFHRPKYTLAITRK